MKKLKISDKQIFGIHVEECIEEDNMFFHEYEAAVKKLNNIWEIQKGLQKNVKQKGISENPNNIIAFCGERGTGKSSVMLSFMKALGSSGKRQDKFNFNEEIRNNNWSTQIMIDPSMFDGVHNIVDIVLSHIYYNFHEAYNKDNQKIDQFERQEMLSLLAKTYKSLSIIKNKEKMMDDEYDVAGNISKLQNLGESTQLRSSFEQLIARYLEIIPKLENKTRQNSEKLLIAIDDLDLCNEHAYEMAEQIRKYLILPNVIILMAIKIEQLEMGVEEKNRGDFKNVIAGRMGEAAMEREMRDMAERYVTKLVPKARRIYLPKLESTQVNLELESEVQMENTEGCGETIENKIVRLIREKTGMFLVPVENSNNYFVPGNLRELVNLILILDGMKQPNGSTQIVLENIYDFHSYFQEEMMKKNISGERLTELLEVVVSGDNTQNYNMGVYIDRLLAEKKKEANVYEALIYEFPNTSLAAIVEKLDVAARYLTRKEDYQLFYYIKIYYTILLNERLYENGIISYPLTGGFIWGNTLNGMIPAITGNNQMLLNRERFFINTLDGWNAVADTLSNKEKLSFNIEKKDNSKIYVTSIKEPNKLPEAMCWLLLALLASPSGVNRSGNYFVSKGNLVYDNYLISPMIAVSFENYISNLCSLRELYRNTNLELLGMPWNEAQGIFSAMELENAERIRQARVIVANVDLSIQLLVYCRRNGDYKTASEDRTYQLVLRFFKNVRKYLATNGIGDVDWTKFWVPTGFDEQGRVQGKEIDICRVYANICNEEEQTLRKQMLNSDISNVNEIEGTKLKQNFSQQVKNISLKDYTGKVNPIPSFLRNKTAQYVKTKLEDIANGIQRYTYREKKFPDGFISERIIKLYSEVIDLYIKNPKSEISDSQSNEYKEIAKIKDIIL